MSSFHRFKAPLAALLIASTLLFEAAGYAVQDQLPARARADGVTTPYLSGLFLYLRGERDLSLPTVPPSFLNLAWVPAFELGRQ